MEKKTHHLDKRLLLEENEIISSASVTKCSYLYGVEFDCKCILGFSYWITLVVIPQVTRRSVSLLHVLSTLTIILFLIILGICVLPQSAIMSNYSMPIFKQVGEMPRGANWNVLPHLLSHSGHFCPFLLPHLHSSALTWH